MTYMRDADGRRLDSIPVPSVAEVETAIASAIDDLLGGAPGALDTLKELADALGDDANFAATVTAALATKATQAALATETSTRAAETAALDARLDSAEATLPIKADLVGGFVPDAQIPASIARDTEVANAVAALVNSAPGTLDTLAEIATALGNDPNLATTITAALAGKVPTSRQVNGHPLSADVTVSKSDVGLGNVENKATGTLVYAQNTSAIGTTAGVGSAAAATPVPGSVFILEPTTADVWLEWGAQLGNAVVGTGYSTLSLFETNISTGATTHLASLVIREYASGVVSAFAGQFKGKYRLGPVTTTRQFFLGLFLGRDSGTLTTYLCNSYPDAAGGEPYKTWLAAIAE